MCAAQLAIPGCKQRLDRTRPRDGPATRSSKPSGNQNVALAADLELLACALAAGSSLAASCQIVADISPQPHWQRIAVMLRSGLPAAQAWQPVSDMPGASDIAAFMVTSENSGAGLSKNIRDTAQQLRTQAQTKAQGQVERVNVLIALPLTLCYLPAFLLLGLAPVVIGLGLQVFGNA
ncbi:MAG: type II secretion system F family protein [Corynebacterium sp.]|nr:type II secretion system F family protein [Corynebacterium sp.]